MVEQRELKSEIIEDHSEVITKFVEEVFGNIEDIKEEETSPLRKILGKKKEKRISLFDTILENSKAIAFLLRLMEQGSLLKKTGSFLSAPELVTERAKFSIEHEQDSIRGRAKGQPILGYRPRGAPKEAEAFLILIKEQDKEGEEQTRYEIYELEKMDRITGEIGARTRLESLGFGDPKVEESLDLDGISEQLKAAIESKFKIKK